MEGAEILQGVRAWGRVRNGIRAGLATAIGLLGASLLVRLGGWALPVYVWVAIPIAVALGGAWPLGREFLLRAGRQLGVGERLAALEVVLREGAEAFLPFLLAEVPRSRRAGWRLLSLREGGLAVGCLALGAALALVPPPAPGGAPDGEPVPPAAAEFQPAVPAPERPDPEPLAERQVTPFPAIPEPPVYSPYEDLLAALLGLEPGAVPLEELVGRLAREEGLLRSLAQRLRELASGGLSPAERAELVPLARELARADLRERVQELMEREDAGGAAEAAEAVEAALRAVEDASRRGERAEEPGQGSASGFGPGLPSGELVDLPDAGLPNGARAEAEGGPESEGRPGRAEVDQPGTEAGETLAQGPGGAWPTLPVGEERAPVVGGEGPVRAHLVPAIPGEPPAPEAQVPTALSPQEVEVVLRTRGVPPELREVVRRYFELIGGNP